MRAWVLALALAACAPSAAEAPNDGEWASIVLETAPAGLGAREIGALIFRGGLELSSDAPEFGGLSGLEVLDNETLIAVTDAGFWFTARLQLDSAGALIGLEEPRMAPLRDETGALFESKRAADAEGLTQMIDGRFAVSFEQTQTIRIYDLNRDGPTGAAEAGPRLGQVASLPANQGLEAMAATEDGDLVIGAEGGWGSARLWRAPVAATAETPYLARYRLRLGYALVGLDRLPDGRFVALERAYAPGLGARARITRFSEADLAAGGAFSAEELAHLTPPLELDNFEGVAATQLSDGTTRLYIVSDDNFSYSFRTLIYAFDIAESGAD